MKLRCIIIEDESLARELLQNFIGRIDWLELVDSYKAPLEVADLDWEEIDILFTDIEMGELSGIEFLRTLTKTPFVIVTTAYSEYALEGYELNIVDYLLKPFPFERFLKAVNKVKSRIVAPKVQEADKSQPDLLFIQADHKTYRVHTHQIIFIEGMREYARYHLETGEKIMELIALKKLEEKLPSHFIRIHKSYILNRNFIRSFDGVSVEVAGKKLPIGSSYRSDVKVQLTQA